MARYESRDRGDYERDKARRSRSEDADADRDTDGRVPGIDGRSRTRSERDGER